MLALTRATLVALYLPSKACCSVAQVKTPCNVLVHSHVVPAVCRRVQHRSHKSRRRADLKCNGRAGSKQFQSLLAARGLAIKAANENSAQVNSTRQCIRHVYEFSDLCMTCIASLLAFFHGKLTLQEFWIVLHQNCCRCYGELTTKYGLEAIHELKSASIDTFELLQWKEEQVHLPHADLYGANNPSGAVQQLPAVQPATCTHVTNLLSVDEKHHFGIQSEVLQHSHEYLEMVGLARSWWIQALQSAVGTTSIKEGRPGAAATTTTGPQGSAKIQSVTAAAWLESAWETAGFCPKFWHGLWTFLRRLALISAVVVSIEVRSYLVYWDI